MDKEALFRKVIEDNRDRIFRICAYYFQNEHDRDDAYQEVLMRIWEHLASFRERSLISTWVFRVAVNTCLTFIRNDKSRRKVFSGMKASVLTNLPEAAESPEDPSVDLKLNFFRRFMDEITPIDRTLVSLYLEELSTREMAEITGLSEANVRVRIHRVKEKITIKWKEEHHGSG